MAKITWTDQAIEDLEAVCIYIARDAPRYAELFAHRAFEAVERLENFPYSGRVAPEINQNDVREIILGSYRRFYRLLSDEVEILTVHHGARLIELSKLREGE